MVWYQELTLVHDLVYFFLVHSTSITKCSFNDALHSLLRVDGKCNIMELVPFLLASKLACLESNLSQNGANSKILCLRNLLGSCFEADGLPYFPEMPTTTFKHK